MLDLNKLEKQLDEALAKETKESLSEWLYTKKLQEMQEPYLGQVKRTMETISE